MKNKKGLSLMSILIITILVVAIGGVAYWNITQRQLEDDIIDPTACADSTGTLTLNNRSAIAGATDPAPTYTGSINDGVFATTITSGTTTFPIGAKIEVIAVTDDYLDDVFTLSAMPCGGAHIDVPLYYSTSDNPSIRVKNDDGDFMTDAIAGGAINQTNLTAGETLQLEVEFSGTSREASGDGIWVLEFNASSDAEIKSVTLDGQSSIAKPQVHSLNNAGSEVAVFAIPSIVGGVKKTMLLEISLASTGNYNGGIYTDWYSKQKFIDDDKTISYGVEDSDGTAQYENTGDYDFWVMVNVTM